MQILFVKETKSACLFALAQKICLIHFIVADCVLIENNEMTNFTNRQINEVICLT